MSASDLILLAIDRSPTLDLLERALRAGGYRVAIAADSAAVDKILHESVPALAVLAESFSGKNGLELAASLLGRFPTMPVIFFASNDDAAQVRQAMQLGLSDYLSPPLKIDDIILSIKRSQERAHRISDWVRREVRRNTASLEQRMEEVETISRLGRSISASLDMDVVLINVVNAAVKLTGAEEGHLLLLDPGTNELYMRAGRNLEESFVRTFRLPVQDTLAGQVIHTGEPILLNHTTPKKIKTSYLAYSLIYVPLHSRDRVIGVLGVYNRQVRQPFSQHHEKLMTILAEHASSAILNAQYCHASENERTKLETTLHHIQDGVILLDENQKIILLNPAMRNIFNLSSEDLDGKPVLAAIPHADFLALLPVIRETPCQLIETIFKDGRMFRSQYTPIPDVGVVITLEDVTHMKMLDRLKSDFIHTISHDLRSPLTAVLGYVELLERVGPLNEQQKQFVKHIQTSAQNITILVNDLLDLGRIESGLDMQKEDVALNTVLKTTADNLGTQIREKQITFKLSIEPDIPVLRGNPVRLRQMVDNLLVNAIKYTPQCGEVSATLRSAGDQVHFEVSDTGVGIPLPDQPHIFDKFYRASNAPRGIPGTGLGLAIVRSIVENHQGRIWVESTPGSGTKFTVSLPFPAE
jgi:two-component system NtrC family sensor kinase